MKFDSSKSKDDALYICIAFYYFQKNVVSLYLKTDFALSNSAYPGIICKSSLLSLKAPITTAADDKFCDIFPQFSKK